MPGFEVWDDAEPLDKLPPRDRAAVRRYLRERLAALK
jgi:hypothetical protein